MEKNDYGLVRTRFAPSPTGYLHIGGLRTALYAFLFARANGGKFLLRIEDTDLERYVEGSVEIIYRTLKDAGLVYDEGPDVGGDYGPYIQSERRNTYLEYAKKMTENGSAYYCFCTKERLEKLHADGETKYDKHCLKLSKDEVNARIQAGEPYVIRQNIPTTGATSYTDLVFGEIVVENKDMEDNVLIKSDGMPTYNFANVVDDHLMNITYVIRGTEYLSSTPKYNLIYKGLGWETPKYMHLQPIMKDATRKLSKRYGDASYEDFISKGAQIALDAGKRGLNVCVNYKNNAEKADVLCDEIIKSGGYAQSFKADVADLNEVDGLFKAIEKAFGGIHILVNNAGTAHFGQIQDLTKEQLNNVFNINILSAVYACSKAAPFMISKKWGRIINISSVWGLNGASCESVYSASKSSFTGFTKALSKELSPSGITVNCIAPGIIDTDMNSHLQPKDRQKLLSDIPVGRFGTPFDVSALAAFLYSEEASYLTGQIITVDGGFTDT
ncbi:glutamate--trna ligase [Holotrichia oblita]|nr:glutamate--trna ligase [Holotrichia oblita]